MEHELVIFDNSGVLVDSEALGNLLLARMLTDEVVPTAFTEAVEHYMGKSFADVVEAVHRRTGAALPHAASPTGSTTGSTGRSSANSRRWKGCTTCWTVSMPGASPTASLPTTPRTGWPSHSN